MNKKEKELLEKIELANSLILIKDEELLKEIAKARGGEDD